MSWVSLAVSGVSTILSASGSSKASSAATLQAQRQAQNALFTGQQRKVAANYEADQLDQNAGQAIAASQRDSADVARQARLAESRALALSAASGGGASSPTVMKIIADMAGEGAYRSSVALYGGEEQARSLRMAAAGRRWEGDSALQAGEMGFDTGMGVASTVRDAGDIAAGGSVVSGGLSLYSKWEGDSALQAGEMGFDTGMGVASTVRDAGDIAAGGSVVSGGLSLYSKYGMGGPAANPSEGALNWYGIFTNMADPAYG